MDKQQQTKEEHTPGPWVVSPASTKTATWDGKKKIEDYLHLYLGAECMADDNKFKLHGVEKTDTGTLAYDGTMINGIHQCWWVENCEFKIFLRPLSDMTKEEKSEWIGLPPDIWATTPMQFLWFLSRHFDLFGLIEAGLALDSTRQRNENSKLN